MNHFLRFAAYLFHPLFMPLLGVLIYYTITPRYIEPNIIKAKILTIVIITILIPMVSFFLLKNLRLINSIHLENVKERKFPLMIHTILVLLVIKMIYSPYENPELYYFFVGILLSTLTSIILIFFKFKVSLHQMGIAGVTMFLIALSIHFKINLLVGIGVLFFFNGWIASSRLHTRSHNYIELIIGFFLGVIPQIIVLNFWL